MAKTRNIDAFMNGELLIKVNSKTAVKAIFEQILAEDEEAMNKIADEYFEDIGVNSKASAYYLTYYGKQHALKAMAKEYYDIVYCTPVKAFPAIEM